MKKVVHKYYTQAIFIDYEIDGINIDFFVFNVNYSIVKRGKIYTFEINSVSILKDTMKSCNKDFDIDKVDTGAIENYLFEKLCACYNDTKAWVGEYCEAHATIDVAKPFEGFTINQL